MGFILDGLDTESYDRQYSDKDLVKGILHYFSPEKTAILWIIITLTLNSLMGSLGPIIISRAIDELAKNFTLSITLLAAGGIAIIGILGWVFNYLRQKISAEVIGRVVLNIRSKVLEKTITHDLSFYDDIPSGKIVSRITSDTQDFANVVGLVIDFLSQFVMVFIIIIFLFAVDWQLTFILIAMAPVAVFIALGFRKMARKVTQQAKRVTAKINAEIQESISGITIAKNFRKEMALYQSFKESNQQAFQVGIRRGIVINVIFPLISIAAGLGTGVVAVTAGMKVLEGQMSAGQWYLFMAAVGYFWWPILNIASFWSQFQDGLSAAERVFALIDREPKVVQTGNTKISQLKGNIRFKNLHFAYSDKEKVLEDFTLDIPQGQTLAIVGHTGAGKSSLARLILRFYEFQQGDLLIDEENIKNLDLGAYRRRIGFVPQDPFLFSSTVFDNIRYGNEDALEEDIIKAANMIGQGKWLDDLAEGIKTHVGQRGTSLSMGQRQLVALARIILKNPDIFILDEATASVDPFTEVQIQEGLDQIMEKRTSVIIAHRLSTVKKANRIIVLHQGRIIEDGKHQELLDQKGHYAELYNTYFRHQSLEYINQIGQNT
ncbi:MAG: ABC transporter ATP-binding protein [Spirochaetales bacterium]|nr:ABC transporter ATP-binding protein [Spirochaetales bacterium]